MRRYSFSTFGSFLTIFAYTVLASVNAHASESLHYSGVAYTPDGSRELYREEHFVFDDNGERKRLVLYRCPSGRPFARKWVRDANSESPDFDLVDARTGYREGVASNANAREVYTQADSHSPRRSASLQEHANAVIDAGFDVYVRNHWNTLSNGNPIAFVVSSRLGYVNLIMKDTSSDATTRHLRLSFNAWYGFAAPSIDLTYETADRRLIRFEGISNVRDAHNNSQQVRIDFPRSAEQPAPSMQDIQRAAALPLTDHCDS